MATAPDLKLEADECATLSPDSERFKHALVQVRPRSAEEVRKLLGLSDESAAAVRAAGGGCCDTHRAPAGSAEADDLEAEDPDIRQSARALTYSAFNAYVYGSAKNVEHLTPVFERYLEVSKAVLNTFHLADIEVMDGATLTIAANTHAIYANKVIIHRTGRIVCHGPTTFKIHSLEGLRRTLVTATAATKVAAAKVSKH